MARKLKIGEEVLFRSGDKLQIGTVTETYVRSKKRLYTVEAESGQEYRDLPCETSSSPRYRIELTLTEKRNKAFHPQTEVGDEKSEQ